MRIGIGKGLGAEITLVVDLAKRIDDGAVLHVPQTHRAAVAVDEVNVTDPFASANKGIGDVRFFDIHVKQIAKQTDVVGR